MDLIARVSCLAESDSIGGAELGDRAVFQNIVNDRVVVAELFQNVGTCGVARLGLFAVGESQLAKENLAKLLGERVRTLLLPSA